MKEPDQLWLLSHRFPYKKCSSVHVKQTDPISAFTLLSIDADRLKEIYLIPTRSGTAPY